MIKNFFDENTGIVRVQRQGDISHEDLINHINELSSKYDYLDKLYVLEDARELFSTFSKNDYVIL